MNKLYNVPVALGCLSSTGYMAVIASEKFVLMGNQSAFFLSLSLVLAIPVLAFREGDTPDFIESTVVFVSGLFCAFGLLTTFDYQSADIITKASMSTQVLIALFLPACTSTVFREISSGNHGTMAVPEISEPVPDTEPEPDTSKNDRPLGEEDRVTIRNAYQDLVLEGHSNINSTLLRERAKKSKTLVCKWLRETPQEARMTF